MSKAIRNKKGFTMIELMIVAIIVAILAVVLIPLMSGNKVRAYETECAAGLGTIRTAMRVHYADVNTYQLVPATGDAETIVPGFNTGDLNGTYFRSAAYTITASSPTDFTAQCNWEEPTNLQAVKDISNNYITNITANGLLGKNY